MERKTANEVLKMLMGYYPRQYPSSMTDSQKIFLVDDFTESFAKFPDEDVIASYKEWHLENDKAPTVANMMSILRKKMEDKAYKRQDTQQTDVPPGWLIIEHYEPCNGCKYKTSNCQEKCWKYKAKGQPIAYPPEGFWERKNEK